MGPATLRSRPLRVGMLGMEWVTTRPGGLARYLADLRDALEATGVEAVAVAVGPAPPESRHVWASAGHLGSSFARRAARYWLRAQSLDVDVVDAHFAPYAFLPLHFGRLRRVPLVVHFQGSWARESAVEGATSRLALLVKRGVERAVYRRAAELVVLSGAFRRSLVEDYGVSPWRVSVLPPGVDLDRFCPGSRRDARDALGLPHGVPVVVAVRRLVARTGIDVLIDAWVEVVREHPRALLVVVGEGPLRGQLEGRAARAGVAAQTRFLGRVDDGALVSCYRAADVSVVPTLALEGFGLSVLEALACGTPVVATDAGGLPEALAGLANSVPVPANDPGALGERLKAALRLGPVTLPPAQACRAHAERFSWESVARANLSVYRRALGKVSGPRRLRVVYLGHCARLSGAEIVLLRLLPALVGLDCHVILAEDGPLVGRLVGAGVSVEVLRMPERGRDLSRDQVGLGAAAAAGAATAAAYALRIARRLRRLAPDLVHANGLKASIYGGVAGGLARVPVIWHVHDRIAPDYMPAKAVAMVRGLSRLLPAAVLANSESTLATLRAHRGPASVIRSAVCIPAVTRPPRAAITVGMLGRLTPWKGQDIFLAGFALAFPEGTERGLVVGSALFGEEAYEARLRRMVAELGLGDRVELVGFREDVAAELARMDVLVHASVIPEPLGQVVMEGMASGLVVVAAGAGGPAEVITDGVDGLLYPPGNAQALAGALRRLADDSELRHRLGTAAARRAPEWAPERIAGQVEDFYLQVLGRRPAAVGAVR